MAISDLSVVFLWRMDIHAEMVVSRFNTIKPSDAERTPLRLPSNDERALMMSSLVGRSGNGAATIDHRSRVRSSQTSVLAAIG